jgi:D-alanyl-D-alanine carboxypeptidase
MNRVSFGTFIIVLALAVAVAFGLRWWFDGIPASTGGGAPPEASSPRASPTQFGRAPAVDPPQCRRGDELTPFADPADWRRTLVDWRYRLPASYVPPDLTSSAEAGFDVWFMVRAVVIDDLEALREAAERAAHPIEVSFGYRGFRFQRRVFQDSRAVRGDAAFRFAAKPGHSEHQLGTALDFTSEGMDHVTQAWGRDPTGRWMARNAWRFGFALSFPRGKQEVTCQAYEPWHFRYFGRPMAREIHRSGLTVREYLWDRFHSDPHP